MATKTSRRAKKILPITDVICEGIEKMEGEGYEADGSSDYKLAVRYEGSGKFKKSATVILDAIQKGTKAEDEDGSMALVRRLRWVEDGTYSLNAARRRRNLLLRCKGLSPTRRYGGGVSHA
jgi:hypothetical protein